MNTKLFYIGLCTFISSQIFAQIGIGTTTPDNSAVLELQSTTKGFLLPRLTKAERKTISAPIANGLMIYNTDEDCINFYSSDNWMNPCTGTISVDAPEAPAGTDIIALNCATIQLIPNTFPVNTQASAVLTVPYDVANNNVIYDGGHVLTPQTDGSTTAISDFKLTLRAGDTGSSGTSELIYDLSGTATTTGTVSFIIDFSADQSGGCGFQILVI